MAVTAAGHDPITIGRDAGRVKAVTMQNTELPLERGCADIVAVMECVARRDDQGAVDQLIADHGTRIWTRSDLRSVLEGTLRTATRIEFDARPSPVVPATRMARIRALADLSLRDWATVFGVTHTAVKQWLSTETDRAKVGQVLQALEEAAQYEADLRTWLRREVPGTDVTPLDLLRRDRFRAFRGALRSRAAPPVVVSGDELRRRRRDDESWAVPEAPTLSDE